MVYKPLSCLNFKEVTGNRRIQKYEKIKDNMDKKKKLPKNRSSKFGELKNKAKPFTQKGRRNMWNDKFLHEIQKPKMKELWDNKKDNL